MEKKNLISRYPLIWAWGCFMKSNEEYIISQMEKAVEERAPINSIYKDYITSDWRTVEEIDGAKAKEWLKKFVAEEYGWELMV